MKKRFFTIRLFTLLLFIIIFHTSARAQVIHEGIFPDTDHELYIYRIFGEERGYTIMNRGSIQKEGQGGYLTAALYADNHLNKGNLIFVPRANFYSLLLNRHNGLTGDMNRKFEKNNNSKKSIDEEISIVRKHLKAESDLLLDLPKDSGFYSPVWIDDRGNSKRARQSILYDAEVYPLPEQTPEKAAPMVTVLPLQRVLPQNSAAKIALPAEPQVVVNVQPEIEKKSPAGGLVPPVKKAQQRAPVTGAIAPPTPAPVIIAAGKIEQPQKVMAAAPVLPKDKQQILLFVERWRQAWVSKEIDPYIAFYDKTFVSSGKNLVQWKAHKAKLNKKYSSIAVNISDIKVNWTGDGATVSFKQEYRSDRYSATGKKTLFLIFKDPGWKIKREVYSRI